MSKPIHSDLLAEIEQYCLRHGMSRSAFGIQVMRDPRFVSDLEKGRELRRSTISKVRDGLSEEPAKGAA